MMNDKAEELGMDGTHFVNTTGLHHVDHYATVWDMFVLLQYALKNDTFYEIFTATRHTSQPTNLHEDGVTYQSTLFSSMDNADFGKVIMLGGKTGYIDEVGQCLASLAEIDGEKYILVTSGAHVHKKQNLHIDDAMRIYTAVATMNQNEG